MKDKNINEDRCELIHKEGSTEIEKILIYVVCIIAILYGMYGIISIETYIKNNYSKKIDVSTDMYSLYYVNKIVCEDERIYLLDSKDHVVQIFNFEGQHLFTFEISSLKPIDMSVKNNMLYVIVENNAGFNKKGYEKYEVNVKKIAVSKHENLNDYKKQKSTKNEYTSKSGEKFVLKNKAISSDNINIKLKDIPNTPKSITIYEYLMIIGAIIFGALKYGIIEAFVKKSEDKEKLL